MNDTVSEFIRSKNINSIQKLNLLLFFDRHPEAQGTSRWFTKKLYLGDLQLMEENIKELKDEGVIRYDCQHYCLADCPEIRTFVRHLARSFDHPLTRQTLLAEIQSGERNGIYR